MAKVIEMRGITKRFPGIVANDSISLELEEGEVHALLGENGAGKSTLMSILFGLYQADEGEILIRGKPAIINSPNVANALGIGMVHQHFKLVHNFTVTQNIMLGREPMRGPFVDHKAARRRVVEISKKYGFDVDPDSKIEDISVGMQQRVEILKMLYRDADILILDEPSAVLMPQEIVELMQIIKNLKSEGKSILLITHKLKEIKAIAERCSIIRRGKLIATVNVNEATESGMAEMMVGRNVSFHIEKRPAQIGKPILEIRNLSVLSKRKTLGLKNLSLDVHAGEILGIAGVEGNGQGELVEAISALRKPLSGTISLEGKSIEKAKASECLDLGLAHIPEDRQRRGLVLDFSLEDNLVLEEHRKPPFSRRGFLNRKAIRSHAMKVIEDFDVRSGEGHLSSTRSMSGGNQQKAIVGREISRNPLLLLAVQPTRGLDVGSIEYIHKRLIEQRDKGKAVLLVSLELDEILELSDRIAVLSHGELIGIVDAKSVTDREIGLMMAGVNVEIAK